MSPQACFSVRVMEMNPEDKGYHQAVIQSHRQKGWALLKTSFSGKDLARHRLCGCSCTLGTLLSTFRIQRLILLPCL